MRIYCCGIGGIGLSAYAALRRSMGDDVAGSDSADSTLLDDLRSQGITVHLIQDGSAIVPGIDLLVYSEAIPVDALERVKALQFAIPQMSYFQALGELSRSFDVIAVCGTHGKSSTTAMAARLLIEEGFDPTVVVGTKVPELDGRNWRRGLSRLFLVEACEYRRNFQFLHPKVAILTNVDGDHFDAFRSVEEYRAAFVDFLRMIPADGVVITHGRDPDCVAVARAAGVTHIVDADELPLPVLSVPGLHMRQNAQLALALARHVGVAQDRAQIILRGFSGTWRRMERKGTWGDDVLVIDDYGHHPVEIRATLNALREAYPDRRIVCVFQPHTHDRTLKLYDDFRGAFSDADLVIVPNVYGARRNLDASETVDVDRFVEDVSKKSTVEALNGCSLDDTKMMLERQILKPHDLLVFMGAGDVTTLAEEFAERKLVR